MEKNSLLHTIKATRLSDKKTLVDEISQAFDLLEDVDTAKKAQIESTLINLQDSLEGGTEELIKSNIFAFRDAMKDAIELNPLPAEPSFFSPSNISKIEEQLGESIENCAAGNRTQFRIMVDGIEYKDRVQNLFYRISNKFIKGSAKATDGRYYIKLRKKGLIHDKAILETKKQISESLPIKEEIFTPDLIQDIENALKVKSIKEISSKDRTAFSVTINGKTYSDVAQNLFYRIANKIFGLNSPALGKEYLFLVRSGYTNKKAKEMALNHQKDTPKKERKSRTNSLPTNPDFYTKEVINKIQKALRRPLNEVSVNDETLFTVTINDEEYQDKPVNLFERVASTILHEQSKARARAYLILLGEGLTPDKTTEKKELKKAGKVIPADIEFLNLETILQIEEQLGKTIENVSVGNNKEFSVKICDVVYTDTVCNLFNRIANKFFEPRKTRQARLYLKYRKDQVSHRRAVIAALKSVENQPIKERNRNPIPISPEILEPSFILELERILNISIENWPLNDERKFNIQIAEIDYQDRIRSFLIRIARTFLESENQRLGKDYLMMRKRGKSHEEAKLFSHRGEEYVEEDEFKILDKLELNDAIALLGQDPMKLKLYLQYAHKELSEDDIDKLVIRSFKGLVNASRKKEEEYLEWNVELPDINLDSEISDKTENETITVSGSAPNAEYVYVAGAWNRRVSVKDDGSFCVTIPLKIGEYNEIRIMSLNREEEQRSEQQIFSVVQEGEADDIDALFRLLSEMRTDLQIEISKDPGRLEFFTRCAEKMLIKKFSLSFAEGEAYIEKLMINTKSKIIKSVLQNVLKRFRSIEKAQFPNVQAGTLRFFQKYTAHEIRRRMKEGRKGINIANDPGTGKTRTILAAVADQEVSIFTPNAVVSTWDDEAGKVLVDPDLLVLRNAPHQRRKELLRSAPNLRLVTNVQFLQNAEDAERFQLLSNDNTVIVHDEAHSRANEGSQQSKGAKKLRHKFQINVTATLAKNPKMLRRMLATLEPDNPKFKSDEAFNKAFPAKDPQALKALKLLVDKYTIRFRKEDVLEEVDPDTLLSTQLHRLPKKMEVPPEDMGGFEMSEAQAQALYEMFINWPEWTKKYDHYIPKDKVSEEDQLRVGGTLVKRHALRQTVNNPAYINSQANDAKLREAEKIIKSCMKEGRKVVIFCAYASQAQKYAAYFARYNPALYTGITSKEGEKKDATGNPQKFLRKQAAHGFSREWELDAKGYPKAHPNGEPMQALDYELMTFQNAPDRQLAICTYNAGSVGTTFTAGKAMILDDLPRDVVEDIQAKDRIHRIDPHHMTHPTVKYFSMVSRYPQEFLDRMKKRWVVKQPNGTYKEYRSLAAAQKDENISEKNVAKSAFDMFFAQGTYDQVHSENLKVQRHMFRLINDGIGDESILKDDQLKFTGLENGNGH